MRGASRRVNPHSSLAGRERRCERVKYQPRPRLAGLHQNREITATFPAENGKEGERTQLEKSRNAHGYAGFETRALW